METSTKATVEIIQELISLQSAKLEKLASNNKSAEQHAKEHDPVIAKLMSELSQHGDSVGSTVEKTDPYYDLQQHNDEVFKQAIDNVLKQAGQLPESLHMIINEMTNS